MQSELGGLKLSCRVREVEKEGGKEEKEKEKQQGWKAQA